MAASIDGYIASRDGDVEWLHEHPNPNNNDYVYSKFMENIDALVMGCHTFEKVGTFVEWHCLKKGVRPQFCVDRSPR